MMSYTHRHVRMKDVRDTDMKRQCGHLTSTAGCSEASGAETQGAQRAQQQRHGVESAEGAGGTGSTARHHPHCRKHGGVLSRRVQETIDRQQQEHGAGSGEWGCQSTGSGRRGSQAPPPSPGFPRGCHSTLSRQCERGPMRTPHRAWGGTSSPCGRQRPPSGARHEMAASLLCEGAPRSERCASRSNDAADDPHTLKS